MRWIVRIVLFVVVVAALAVGALFLLPADRIAGFAAERFEDATGRAMTLGGDIRPTIWPELGVRTGPVRIANADWSQEGPILSAEALTIGVDVLALIRGDIRITGVEVQAPEVVLEIASDGRANWDMGTGADSAAPEAVETEGGTVPAFRLDEAVIRSGALTFIDHAGGSRMRLDEVDATLRLPDFEGPADMTLAATMNGQRLSLEAQVSQFAAFLARGAVPVALTAEVGGSTLSFDGRAGLVPVAAGGTLDADMADMAAVFALLGRAAPEIPEGLGRSIRVQGQVTATEAGKVTLRDGTVRLDDNTLAAAADLVLTGARPKLTAQVTAGALDVSALAGAGSSENGDAAGGGGDAAGWSRTPIDVSGLQALDAEIAFVADSVELGLARLGRTSLLMTLLDGRAVTEIRQLSAYDGLIQGSFVVNSRGGLSVRANLTGAGVALQPLLEQLAGSDRLLADGEVTLNLLGVGNDMHSLMTSLSGDGALSLGQGELRGLDLAGMLRNLDTSYVGAGQKTIFDSIDATFRVENGVLSNDDLALLAPLVNATGTGQVGLGARTLDYRLLPILLEGAEGEGGLRVPLIVSGPWNAPRFRLDLEALVTQEFGDEIEALKGEVESKVTERISEELGVEVESLDNVEETLQEELENRARETLRGLFGGN
ncbi:AsmA family protein [Psychromarinibacter sp. C21-152]|uniref:AsmA family protein n=1 Tax=Psychromarinibacter sediminicola TaxID=3033385 RepID=A0AAE3NUG4_9RHOB|nr:AsmA family protein [Psychromarinibacter sediminicola]MDF0602221.1 AsmA family protein [Psychromarinibacter sediminicola]